MTLKLSKASELALKANKVYVDNSELMCYWHKLSADELKSQIFTIANKQEDKLISYTFSQLSSAYKAFEEEGIKEILGSETLVPYAIEFLNDAKIEYTGKPFLFTIT
jgi:hypothetical protein